MGDYLLLGAGLALVLLLWVLIRMQRRIRELSQSIYTFFLSGTVTPISTRDDVLGRLQTDISELENRLIQERDGAKREAKEHTEFLSDISHQLKTPLAGLRLYCELEQSAGSSAYSEKELALVEKMETLIQNILTLEKIRSDTYEMQFSPAELSQIARQVQMELHPLFPQKQILLTGNAQLRADPAWLREALGNVVKNACEHTRPEGIVEIRMEQGERSVTIFVEDDGGGVDPAELPMLFLRFHKAKSAAPNSTGIGLAITKAIVEKHHGIITAQNGRRGLLVTMCLPIIDANLKI